MVSDLCQRIFDTLTFQSVRDRIQSGQNVSLSGLMGSSDVIVAAGLAKELLNQGSTVFLVTPDPTRYAQITDDWMTMSEEVLSGCKTLLYPDDELLPYDDREMNAQIAAFRQETLEYLLRREPCVVLTTARALVSKVFPPGEIESYKIELRTGAVFEFTYLLELLDHLGFDRQDVVDHAGTYAVRGGIIDVFGFAMENPVRLEFLGNSVDSIRSFDVMSQRSLNSIAQVTLYPRAATGAFGTDRETMMRYWTDKRAILRFEPELASAAVEKYWEEIVHQYENRKMQIPESQMPSLLFETSEEVRQHLDVGLQVHFCRLSRREHEEIAFKTFGAESFNGHVQLLREKIVSTDSGMKHFILCNNSGQVERLDDLLDQEQCRSGVDYRIGVGELHEGFSFPEAGLNVYTDHQIFGRGKRFRVYRRFKSAQALRHLSLFKAGDFVVHVDHGIGKYAGLEKVVQGDHVEECLKILYKDGDKVFVPLVHFQRVQKFSGAEGVEPKLNKLGSGEWEKLKSRTRKTVKDIAQDLIKLYAERKMRQGFKFGPDAHLQHELEGSFEYEDTPDQSKVTAEVKQDMESETPMDRLVCGDVGYGKTEVAIRAAFKCVHDGKQAAVLVPTTILADQHFETFSSRLREFPVRVDVISRFKSPKEQKDTLEKTKKGEIDILIGTHRILSKDVEFKDLGLLIVDEEQRFGVTHKEKLRRLKATVDTLTLTATPIPRTLHFSLMGGRDLSLIQTPPQDRLPVKTEITHFDEKLIHDAILQEIDRGGQVYFVHNRVQSIERTVEVLRSIVPRARFAVVHGQMPASKVENVVHAFMRREFDVLVATSIIENGIDIPNVNTILIDQAHHFGLAQLYQLRGRVGRSSKQAYCYLLTMPYAIMPTDALRRLQAIEEFSELGSGFMIAMRDLEIRGAGNLLGAEQSGFVNAVGFELYCQIVEEAVAEAKNEALESKGLEVTDAVPPSQVQITVYCSTYIPDSYVDIASERIQLYKNLSLCANFDSLSEIRREMVDRFGPIPPEAENLLKVVELRLLSQAFLFNRIDAEEDYFTMKYDVSDISTTANERQFKKEISWWLDHESNLRLHQDKTTLTVKIGMPWLDIQKQEKIGTMEPWSEADILGFIVAHLQAFYTYTDRMTSKVPAIETEA